MIAKAKRIKDFENEVGERAKRRWLLHLEMVPFKPRRQMLILL